MNSSPTRGRGMPKPMAPAAMFPSPQQPATGPSPSLQPTLGLSRYGSAPGSFLSSISDAAAREDAGAGGPPGNGGGGVAFMGRFFTGESSSSSSPDRDHFRTKDGGGGRGPVAGGAGPPCPSSYGMGEYAIGELTVGTPSGRSTGGGGGGNPLVRHSSSPAGFLSHLMLDNGFPATRETGDSNATGNRTTSTLKSQLSFSGRHPLSQISELGDVPGEYGLQKSSMDMATVEKYLQMQHDQVPFKVRAKRGCATHPRSIAERERRTRISEKLRKLQELVPNMDKQTNTADMLDLAAQHIKGLKTQVQILTQERESCTCSNKRDRN